MAGIVVEDAIMDLDLFSVLVGAAAAIVGGIIGGWVQGWAWYHYEQKRAAAEEKKRWMKIALEWAATGRKESLRRADLSGADLRGADLGLAKLSNDDPIEARAGEGADLSYANLSKADLRRANLTRADLQGADLREANLTNADLREANLYWADLQGVNVEGANLQRARLECANLQEAILVQANLQGARYNNRTVWPIGFTPPLEAVNVGAETNVED